MLATTYGCSRHGVSGSMMCVALKDRALVRMSGADAETLLQDVISCDVVDLPVGQARPGALLTPQGKILFEFLISRSGDDGFVLDMLGETSSGFIQRMTLYKLRASVTIETADDQTVHAFWAGEQPEGALVDARFPVGVGVYRLYGASPLESAVRADYDQIRIESGVAEAGRDYDLSDAFPHDVLMDLNNGISRSKGCYVGQEVVSRMLHRGTARRRVALITSDQPLPETGTPIESGGRPMGQLGTVVENQALAIVRTDRVASALDKGLPITADGTLLNLTLPVWTGLQFPTKDQAVGEPSS